MIDDLSPALIRLRAKPRNPEPRTKGNKHAKLSRKLAAKICDAIASSTQSVFKIIADNPDFPSFNILYHWQQRVPWFNAMWKQARIRQAEFLVQSCLDLAKSAEPKTAHVVRVKFDVYRFIAAKFSPDTYGDKPLQNQQTTVNVGVHLSAERLNELRSKLDSTRSHFVSVAKPIALPNGKQLRTSDVNDANNHD